MTTILEPERVTSLQAVPDVHLPIALVALDDITHGAGSAGNTSLLRTQPVIYRGQRVAVPYVSGNSMRHRLRDALAWHLVRTLQVAEMSLARRVVDLLWSGGALTSTGSKVDLGMLRRVATTLLGTSALGYSARSDIVAGTTMVDNVHVVCRENGFRLPPALAGHPNAALPAAAFRGKTFRTRKAAATTNAGRYIKVESAADLFAAMDTDADAAAKADKRDQQQQMIYDVQVIRASTLLWTGVHLYAPTWGHQVALAVALDEAAPEVAGQREIALGGKRSTGFGRAALYANFGQLGDLPTLRATYEGHLRDNREQVLSLMQELVG